MEHSKVGRITINISGRDYTVACGQGQEEQINALAKYINKKAATLSEEIGYASENLFLVMILLMIADENFEKDNEIYELKKLLAATNKGSTSGGNSQDSQSESSEEANKEASEFINMLTGKIESLTERIMDI